MSPSILFLKNLKKNHLNCHLGKWPGVKELNLKVELNL